MQSKPQICNLIFRTISRAGAAALVIATVFALTGVLTRSVEAQTFKVLHTFTGGQDGSLPGASLTIDKAGNLYGTAGYGGSYGNGTVFKLSHKGSGWVFTPLYSFLGKPDGANPDTVIIGPDGSIYGTTSRGGLQQCGLRDGDLRDGFQLETLSGSLQNSTLPVDGNRALSPHRRPRWRFP